ncbi:MAG TPA: nucleotide sugar dehydrogenase [Acidimicrobiia bacterium]|jgi:GDP-mannose 6-dehydrogenase|nr:nucleotide sugar dehydrogenase [Acidimicrobiia bacterium]
MRVAIFGLGYVGSVTAGCLTRDGHHVVGVDPNLTKLELLRTGRSPVIEPGLDQLIQSAAEAGRLEGTTSAADAVERTDLAFVCVGTPSQKNGQINLDHVQTVMDQIGSALRERTGRYIVVLRSTVLPGTTRNTVVAALEASSGKTAGVDFDVCFVPEFLREGSAVADYFDPPKTVIGSLDGKAPEAIHSLFERFEAPLIITDLETAEMIKYVDNAWHAVKVGFANEVGRLARAANIDGRRVMDIFTEDTKLNISTKYLRPGQAFGGSCLPKDLRAIEHHAKTIDLDLPIMSSVLPSNDVHLDHAFDLIEESGSKQIGILGLSFKGGTDDVRESPMMELAERLIGKGYDLRIHDPVVSLSALVGANREFLMAQIPHISQLLVESIDDVVRHAETIVIGTDHASFKDVISMRRDDQTIVDLIGLVPYDEQPERYRGICW